MAYTIPEKLQRLKPYTPSPVSCDVILNANESFMDAGSRMEQKIREALAAVPLNRYPDPACTALRAAYAKLYDLDAESITVSNGSDEMIALILSALLPDRAKVATIEPDFSMYSFYAQVSGHELIHIEKPATLEISADTVIERLNVTGAQLLIFSNPGNPTSLVLKREEVLRIVRATKALVVVDEAYMEFSDQSILKNATDYENLIVLRTCSKALGLASLRLGMAVASPAVTRLLNTVRSPFNVGAVSQAIGEAVLSDAAYLKECTRAIIRSREALYQALLQIQSEQIEALFRPQTNFVLMKMKSAAAVDKKLQAQGISVRLLGDYIRVTAGSDQENERFIRAFQAILEEAV